MDDDSAVYTNPPGLVSPDTAVGELKVYGGYAGYNITPAITVKGAYYYQDLDDRAVAYINNIASGIGPGGVTGTSPGIDDNAQSWKVILDIKQEALKFTSLWVEYNREDNNFYSINDRYALGGGAYDYVAYNRPINDQTSDYIFVFAKQQWTDKFSTFARYVYADFDTDGLDDAHEWGVGVGYQYTPAVYFELAYVQVDHGTNDKGLYEWAHNDKESVVRFRTQVTF